jgi:PadR family transcriptional regulator AphA
MDQAARTRALPVEYAALGCLADSRMHGYELQRTLSRRVGSLWRIASSQLYNVLHRIEEDGWIDSTRESDSARPSRTVYRITPKGEAAFESWLGAPVEHLRDIRVEFLAKIYFARRRGHEVATKLVAAQMDVLESLEAGLARRVGLESDDEVFGRIVVSFRRKRVRSMIEWLEENRESLSGTEGVR